MRCPPPALVLPLLLAAACGPGRTTCTVTQTEGGGARITCPGRAPVAIEPPGLCTLEPVAGATELRCSDRPAVKLPRDVCGIETGERGQPIVICGDTVLDPEGGFLSGRIAGRVEMPDGDARTAVVELVGHSTVIPDAAGFFAFEDLAPGTYDVQASAPGRFPASGEVRVGAGNLDLELELLAVRTLATRVDARSLPTGGASVGLDRRPLPELAGIVPAAGPLRWLPAPLDSWFPHWSPDERWLWDGALLHDSEDGSVLPAGEGSAAFSLDGTTFVLGRGPPDEVTVMDLRGGDAEVHPLPSYVRSVLATRTGAFLRTGQGVFHVRRGGAPVLLLEDDPRSDLVVAPDGELGAASGSSSGTFVLDPDAERAYRLAEGVCGNVVFAPGGTAAACGGQLWRAGLELPSDLGLTRTATVFSPDATAVAVVIEVDRVEQLLVREVASGEETLVRDVQPVAPVFGGGGRFVFFRRGAGLAVLDRQSGRVEILPGWLQGPVDPWAERVLVVTPNQRLMVVELPALATRFVGERRNGRVSVDRGHEIAIVQDASAEEVVLHDLVRGHETVASSMWFGAHAGPAAALVTGRSGTFLWSRFAPELRLVGRTGLAAVLTANRERAVWLDDNRDMHEVLLPQGDP